MINSQLIEKINYYVHLMFAYFLNILKYLLFNYFYFIYTLKLEFIAFIIDKKKTINLIYMNRSFNYYLKCKNLKIIFIFIKKN